jgi:hypothetical protein
MTQYPRDKMHAKYTNYPSGCNDRLYNAFRFDYECFLLNGVLVMEYNDPRALQILHYG